VLIVQQQYLDAIFVRELDALTAQLDLFYKQILHVLVVAVYLHARLVRLHQVVLHALLDIILALQAALYALQHVRPVLMLPLALLVLVKWCYQQVFALFVQ
jgi:hypothetical protein